MLRYAVFSGAAVGIAIAALTCTVAAEEKLDRAMGTYVPLLVDNFPSIYTSGTSKNEVCVAQAYEVVDRFVKAGGSVETVFAQPKFALYKVIDAKNEHIIVQCNQNGSLIVGWKTNGEIASFVASAAEVGISLREKEINNQSQPQAPTIINSNNGGSGGNPK